MTSILAATCSLGLASVVKSEIRALGADILEVTDRMVRFSVDQESDLARYCLSVATANRLYLELYEGVCEDWESLFNAVKSLEWGKYIPSEHAILVRAVSEKSVLESVPTLQATTKKAIVHVLSGGEFIREDDRKGLVSILVLARGNRVSILLDLVGEPLHRRGYRREAGEAPLKESLAAAMLRLCGYNGDAPLLDPVCGSGTLLIEAARMARNILPGRDRSFALQRAPWYDPSIFSELRSEARSHELARLEFPITGSDIDAGMTALVRENARRGGVEADISVSVGEISEYRGRPLTGYIVANPPYGVRLSLTDADEVHRTLSDAFGHFTGLGGAIITPDQSFLSQRRYDEGSKHLKVSNGDMTCYVWYKKGG